MYIRLFNKFFLFKSCRGDKRSCVCELPASQDTQKSFRKFGSQEYTLCLHCELCPPIDELCYCVYTSVI